MQSRQDVELVSDCRPIFTSFQDIFAALDELKLSVAVEGGKEMNLLRTHFLIAVHSPDATVVYYNMARGLVKPVN